MANISKEFPPTEEQEAIMSAASGKDSSLMVQAYAGCAKTTSLELASKKVRIPALAIAFNKATANQLGKRFASNFKVQTMNSLGLGAWMRARPGMTLAEPDGKKVGRLISAIDREWKTKLTSEEWADCRDLVRLVMQAGVSINDEGSPMAPDLPAVWRSIADDLWITDDGFERHYDIAREALTRSIAESRMGILSFDDQVYCSTILGGKFPQYPVIMVDEAQDLSPLNHRMVELSLRQDGRIIAVGDSKQAIYAFRGADSESMEKIRALRKDWVDRPLTMTFRCPKIVVDRQQGHAPGFRAAPTNADGLFSRLKDMWQDEGKTMGGWSFLDLQKAADAINPEATIAVLCRNNAPLVTLAMKLIRSGIGPVMLGRDLGKGMIKLLHKVSGDPMMSSEHVIGSLTAWKDKETADAVAAGQDEKVASINDRYHCLMAIMDSGVHTAGEAEAVIEKVFSREGGRLVLSTIHKAKGLEWDVVMHLDPWRIPSKFALEQQNLGNMTPITQDRNLKYVCETRAKHTLMQGNLDGWNPA